jgi:hypothetical protein
MRERVDVGNHEMAAAMVKLQMHCGTPVAATTQQWLPPWLGIAEALAPLLLRGRKAKEGRQHPIKKLPFFPI